MSKSDPAGVAFILDEKLYPLEAVQNAAYVFTDRAYVHVERPKPEQLKVVMTAKAGVAASAGGDLKGDFDNELMHQVLRHRLSNSNQKIREFIVTKALVSAQPSALVAAAAPAAAPSEEACPDCIKEKEHPSAQTQAPAPAPTKVDEDLEKEIDRLLTEIEAGGATPDPLGVSVPWEDKFGSKAESAKAKAPAKGKSPAKGKKAKGS